jgi:predicted adenine nucleotide alpha hydrolase (AANH) superfamily ATPase
VKVVLHICCGVCAAGAAETLAREGHEVIGFFYNPNIQPVEEYERRLSAAREAAKELNFQLEAGDYAVEEWFRRAGHLKDQPEGGQRCQICYHLRLEKTYDYMVTTGSDAFTTTLTISPHKSAQTINKIGQEIGGHNYQVRDFKKKEGFKRAMELARRWNLYRQHYCGCAYSRASKQKS